MLKYRYRVLVFLCSLGAILYLDRVAVSVAGPRIQEDLVLSAAPPVFGALGNIAGGFVSDNLCKRFGLKWGRRCVGLAGLSCATIFMAATIITTDKYLALLFLGFVYAGITFQQSAFLAVILDVSRQYLGGATGATNMIGSLGAFVFSVSFGYFVTWFGSYDLALIPVAGLLTLGTVSWLRVDAAEEVIPEMPGASSIPEAVLA
jgi:MFS family permease